MGWEKRDRHCYYYRKARTGQRVVSKYVGDGVEALDLALTELEQRAQRQALLEQMKLDDMVEDINRLVSAIVTGAYLATGFYCHHREWRKARHVDGGRNE